MRSKRIIFMFLLICIGYTAWSQEDQRSKLEQFRDRIIARENNEKSNVVKNTDSSNSELNSGFSMDAIFSKIIEPKLYIISTSYVVEDVDGNKYVLKDSKNAQFFSLGVMVEEGLVGGESSVQPWLSDSTYVNEEEFKPVLNSVKSRQVTKEMTSKFKDLDYQIINDRILMTGLNQESGISLGKYSEPFEEDLLLASVGKVNNTIAVHYESYTEVMRNSSSNPSSSFDAYYGSAVFKMHTEDDVIRLSLVGFVNNVLEGVEFQGIIGSELKKMQKKDKALSTNKRKKNKKKKRY